MSEMIFCWRHGRFYTLVPKLRGKGHVKFADGASNNHWAFKAFEALEQNVSRRKPRGHIAANLAYRGQFGFCDRETQEKFLVFTAMNWPTMHGEHGYLRIKPNLDRYRGQFGRWNNATTSIASSACPWCALPRPTYSCRARVGNAVPCTSWRSVRSWDYSTPMTTEASHSPSAPCC